MSAKGTISAINNVQSCRYDTLPANTNHCIKTWTVFSSTLVCSTYTSHSNAHSVLVRN